LTAPDGASAFSLYHEHRADIALVLTDLMMPVMDGLALISALRHLDPNVVVVAASGLNDNNNQIKAAEAGLRHFLCKPYTTAALLPILRSALAQREAAAYGTS
ncbi:MAG: response regulator, partial [Verrucomicrobia bacterium]|nr:response regulator [Verrucomicrobiota bacterium]